MFSYCTNYTATLPDLTVYINCDTRLAVNLRTFNITENDEFIFAVKNYNYIESPYVFLFRARSTDMDENGEVLFKIPPAASKYLKPGAFYNFAVLLNAFDKKKETEYKKLTDNGNIILKYGAQDLLVHDAENDPESEIVSVRLEPIADDNVTLNPNLFMGQIVNMRLELLED